ncbi:MAG: hypothetical protein J6T10_22320 [Methanobrevibacter sp.]|nr:hypothetical protein [Methanobrevibacter sp.]
MRNNLEYNFRTPGKVEMIALMEDIEHEYKVNLESSVSSYDTYERVSDETYNDFRCVLAKLEILLALAIITPAESKALIEEANAMRLNILEGLNKED